MACLCQVCELGSSFPTYCVGCTIVLAISEGAYRRCLQTLKFESITRPKFIGAWRCGSVL